MRLRCNQRGRAAQRRIGRCKHDPNTVRCFEKRVWRRSMPARSFLVKVSCSRTSKRVGILELSPGSLREGESKLVGR
jgi:hypothetical protein